jgi:predicted SAM-dependent methyltransferase
MFGLDFSRSTISIGRSIWSYGKVQRCISPLIRGRNAFMNFKSEGLVLDVGCGPNIDPRKINLDYGWRPGIDICCDITKGLPLKDEYVAGVFTEHCIEHISFDAALFVFGEFRRVMKPGAYVRIIVPDLQIYVEKYNLFCETGELSMPYANGDVRADGIYSPAMSVNRIIREHGHQFIYDFATMAAILKKIGFTDISKASCGHGTDRSLIFDNPGRAVESLYVEARKAP